ncbi:MAG TPA: HAD-IA family hydrolase [Trebonia sp.]|nr:HAD-IA family hydrolase [Trebonia sp.]
MSGAAAADGDDDAPLAGLRVVEVSSFVAAPLAGLTLAQLGAEVIRVDPAGGGPDYTRWPLAPSGASLYWTGLNKGKRSVALDLRDPQSQRAVRDLVAGSGPDGGILITNAGYPWLGYEELRADRGDVIHLRITGTHDGGTAVDYTVNAGIGFPLVTGPQDARGPVNHVLPAWDLACGLYAATGILAAERHRRRTGQGRAITLALADVALTVTGHLGWLAEPALGGQDRPRIGNHLYGSFARDFTTGSGDSILVVLLTSRHFADLGRCTGLGDAFAAVERALGADFSTDAGRYAHREVIAAILAPWFAARTTAEAERALSQSSALWQRYRTFAQVAADPATAAHPLMHQVDQPGVGLVTVPGSPLVQPGLPAVAPAPALGGDTADVLATVARARDEDPGHQEAEGTRRSQGDGPPAGQQPVTKIMSAVTSTAISLPGRTVIFDYGDVISLPQSARDRAVLENLAGVDPGKFWAAYNAHRAALDLGAGGARAYWAQVAADTGADWDGPRVHALWVADLRGWMSVNPEVAQVLADLKAGGTRLALLSNAGAEYGSYFRGGVLGDYFEACYVSGELRLLKPDAAIYRHVLADLGIEARAAVFIDNRAGNVAGAAELGITGHVFTNPGALRAFLESLPTLEDCK